MCAQILAHWKQSLHSTEASLPQVKGGAHFLQTRGTAIGGKIVSNYTFLHKDLFENNNIDVNVRDSFGQHVHFSVYTWSFSPALKISELHQ